MYIVTRYLANILSVRAAAGNIATEALNLLFVREVPGHPVV